MMTMKGASLSDLRVCVRRNKGMVQGVQGSVEITI